MNPLRYLCYLLFNSFQPRSFVPCPLASLLLCVFALNSPSATVTGNLTDISLSPLDTKLIITPTNEVQVVATGLSVGPPILLDTTAGSFSVTLDAGFYTVALPSIPWRRPFLITVPATNGTINITNLIGQIPYVSTNCLVKTTPWDFLPGVLNQKLDVMGALTKFLVTNFTSGAVTVIISNNPASGGGGTGTASALTNDHVQIGLDGLCTFGLLGTPFSISPAGAFSRLQVGDESEHLFNANGTFSLCNDAFTADGAGNLNANSLSLVEDLEIPDTTHGLILKSPNGTRYRIKVADDGTLSTEIP